MQDINKNLPIQRVETDMTFLNGPKLLDKGLEKKKRNLREVLQIDEILER